LLIEEILISKACLINTEKRMQLRKVAFSTFLLGLGVYILLPTADEIIIHPVFGLFLSYVLNLPLAIGVLLSIIIYRAIGALCVLSALLIGGKPIYQHLKETIKKKKQKTKNPQKPA
jgi:hypothetical protein